MTKGGELNVKFKQNKHHFTDIWLEGPAKFVTAGPGSLNATNYGFNFVDGTLTIGQATLTVTADPRSRVYGAANPVFTASYSGFVNGDTSRC